MTEIYAVMHVNGYDHDNILHLFSEKENAEKFYNLSTRKEGFRIGAVTYRYSKSSIYIESLDINEIDMNSVIGGN